MAGAQETLMGQQKRKKETDHRKTRRGGRRHKSSREHSLYSVEQNKALTSNVSNILNISSRTLNNQETALLSRGLNFCPSRHFDLLGTLLDLNKFARSLTLRKHFFEFPFEGEDTSLESSETGESLPSPRRFTEVCALEDLTDLASESNPPPIDPTDTYNKI